MFLRVHKRSVTNCESLPLILSFGVLGIILKTDTILSDISSRQEGAGCLQNGAKVTFFFSLINKSLVF